MITERAMSDRICILAFVAGVRIKIAGVCTDDNTDGKYKFDHNCDRLVFGLGR
ncbi:hypothetical protein [Calothrix sp. NIES-2100]|uniref:hypothetical protein n=1 Tax=Calothrix sp. NIES-2100 TaxID=1954172 RepID=UPI0030DC12B6